MHELKHPYIAVQYENYTGFGGNQQSSESPSIQGFGCGLVAAADLLLYLSRWKSDAHCAEFEAFAKNPIDGRAYNRLLDSMRRRYFHIIPKSGMTGIGLMMGMELFFMRHKLPYSARWCFSSKDIWARIEEMLENDIPVIISVGPNLPLIHKKQKALFYRRVNDGSLVPQFSANSHFMTVTAMDDETLEVSSWGKRLFIKKTEFVEFAEKHSFGFLCNILYVGHK